MIENREALIAHYQEMQRSLLDAIAGIDDAKLTETSLDGWSVKDHLLHVAFWEGLRAEEVERISAGYDTAWPLESQEAFNENPLEEVLYELRKNLGIAQARWELETTHRRMVAALQAASERGLDSSLYGEAALRSDHMAQHTGWIERWRREQGL